MSREYSRRELEEMQAEVDSLPIGYISRKKISGKEYFYRQWAEDGKTKSQYIKKKDLELVRSQIARRKELQEILKESEKKFHSGFSGVGKKMSSTQLSVWEQMPDFETNVQTGDLLERLVSGTREYPERRFLNKMTDYLNNQMDDRICLLTGLRRTGKSVAMYQAIDRLSQKERTRTAYIRLTAVDDGQAVMRDIRKLAAMEYRYLFIDEAVIWRDFAEVMESLADVYGAMGMKLVVSGINPAGVFQAVKKSLYDRALVLHTTPISYREYGKLLGKTPVELYLSSGGMLQNGNVWGENVDCALPERQFTETYIYHVICQNMGQEQSDIVHEKICRMNEEMLLSMFSRDFKLYDWTEAVNRIRGRHPLSKEENHQASEYLAEMGLYVTCPSRTLKEGGHTEKKELFALPWLVYSLVKTGINDMMEDAYFAGLSERDKGLIRDRMFEEAKKQMLANLVLLETRRAKGEEYQVFCLGTENGNYDMLVYDSHSDECWIYMVKYSKQPDKIIEDRICDESLRRVIEQQYGRIIDRCILYLGEEEWKENGVHYQNAGHYLGNLGE